jgi:hypothetical protein
MNCGFMVCSYWLSVAKPLANRPEVCRDGINNPAEAVMLGCGELYRATERAIGHYSARVTMRADETSE